MTEVINAAKASENKRTQRLGTKLEGEVQEGKTAARLTGKVYNRIQNESIYEAAKQRAYDLAAEQGVKLTEREADAIATAAQETRQNARKTADGRIVYTLSPGAETAVQEGIGQQVMEELTNSRKSAEWVEQTREKAVDFARASGAYLDEVGRAQQVEKGIRQRTAETNRALREGNGAQLVTKGVEGVFKNEGEGKDAGVTLYGIDGVTENNGITVVVDSDGKDGVQATATFDLRQNAPAGTVKAADEQTNELLLHLNGALTGQLTQTVTENYGARYNPDLDTRLSLPAANNAIAMYEPAINKSASAYVAWVYDAYKAASRGMAWQSYLELYQHGKDAEWGRYLTLAQLREAFRAGQAQFAPKAGVTRIGTEPLSDKVLTRLAALDETLKNRGFSVIVVDRMEDVNGYISDRADVAVVSLDSEEGLFETAAFHEAYHLVKRELGEAAGRQFISAVLTEYRKAVGNEQFEKDMDAFAKKYAGDTAGLDSEDARWKLYEEMAAQYFGAVATEHMDGLVSRLEEAGGKTLWTKVREALQQFLDDIRAALNRLAGRDPATAAALRTEEASTAHVLELFDEAVKQTEEIRKARLAEQGERIREEAERAESGVRSAESKTRSYKSIKGATAEELGRLADAQRRIADGESDEQVRRETGWFKGYDGKWRLEIDDSKMELLAFNPDVPPSLDQLIVHDELFQAYPFLRDTTVFFLPLKNANGRYNKGENSIDLNRSLVEDAKKLKEALIHEIQHAIQEEEGLSPGANPAYWQRRINNKADNRSVGERKMTEEAAADIIKLNKEMPNSFGSEMRAWFEERPTEPRGKITNWDTLEVEPDSPAWQQWDRRGEELSEK